MTKCRAGAHAANWDEAFAVLAQMKKKQKTMAADTTGEQA